MSLQANLIGLPLDKVRDQSRAEEARTSAAAATAAAGVTAGAGPPQPVGAAGLTSTEVYASAKSYATASSEPLAMKSAAASGSGTSPRAHFAVAQTQGDHQVRLCLRLRQPYHRP